jgi:hypothetical protein
MFCLLMRGSCTSRLPNCEKQLPLSSSPLRLSIKISIAKNDGKCKQNATLVMPNDLFVVTACDRFM